MCSAIIARNIFIVNAVHLYYKIFCYPPLLGQPKVSVTTTDGLVLWWYSISHKIYEGISCVFMHVLAKWIFMNFAWTCINTHEHTWKFNKNSGFVVDFFRVCSSFLGHVTSVWNRHLNFCGSVRRPYYSTQNMWNSVTSIINTYTVASTFMPQCLLWKSAIFAMNKYICLWREKG